MGEKATLDSVMEYLRKFQTQVTDEIKVSKKETVNIGDSVKSLDKKFEDLSENIYRRIDETNEKMSKNKEDTAKVFKRMDERMLLLEDQMKVSTQLRSETYNLRTLLTVQPTGSSEDTIVNEETEKTSGRNKDGNRRESNTPRMETETTPAARMDNEPTPAEQPVDENQQNFSSSWAKEVASQLKLAAEKMSKPKYRNMKQIDEKIEEIRQNNDSTRAPIPTGGIPKITEVETNLI